MIRRKVKAHIVEIVLIFVVFLFAALANALANPSFRERVEYEVARASFELNPVAMEEFVPELEAAD